MGAHAGLYKQSELTKQHHEELEVRVCGHVARLCQPAKIDLQLGLARLAHGLHWLRASRRYYHRMQI